MGVGVTRKGYALKNGGNQIWVEFKYFMIPVFETHLYPTFPPLPTHSGSSATVSIFVTFLLEQ